MTEDQLIQAFKQQHRLSDEFNVNAPKWFIPIAELINTHQKRESGCLFVGLNGSQGSGKSTLADFIKVYLQHYHQLSVAVVSLDDFYLSKKQRQQLATTVHPLLASRGVPGTHDIPLIEATLNALKSESPHCKLPRFDKSIDDPAPMSDWPVIKQQVDVVIMEGWCWGTPEQTDQALVSPVNQLEQVEDKNGTWRKYVNSSLQAHYLPLYQQMDFWLMLKAPSFACIAHWRKEQEHKLKIAHKNDTHGQSNNDLAIMSDTQIERFIQHFQRLTEHGFIEVPTMCNLVLELDENRTPQKMSGKDIELFNNMRLP